MTDEDEADIQSDETFIKLCRDMDARLQAEYDTLFGDIRENIVKVRIRYLLTIIHLSTLSWKKGERLWSKS